MYNFNKLDNEEILIISDQSILKKEGKDIMISTILTNKRLILLDYPEKSNNYEEAMRTSRGADYILQKEPILIIDLDDIKEIINENNFDKYVLTTSNYFYLNAGACVSSVAKAFGPGSDMEKYIFAALVVPKSRFEPVFCTLLKASRNI